MTDDQPFDIQLKATATRRDEKPVAGVVTDWTCRAEEVETTTASSQCREYKPGKVEITATFVFELEPKP